MIRGTVKYIEDLKKEIELLELELKQKKIMLDEGKDILFREVKEFLQTDKGKEVFK